MNFEECSLDFSFTLSVHTVVQNAFTNAFTAAEPLKPDNVFFRVNDTVCYAFQVARQARDSLGYTSDLMLSDYQADGGSDSSFSAKSDRVFSYK